jgi:Trk K+ transport system NAD-binding subunit
VEGNYHLLVSIPELVGMSASIDSGNKMIGRQVKKLEGNICRVAFIERYSDTGSESIIRATPDLFFKEGDRLMLFVKVKQVKEVEKQLSGS